LYVYDFQLLDKCVAVFDQDGFVSYFAPLFELLLPID